MPDRPGKCVLLRAATYVVPNINPSMLESLFWAPFKKVHIDFGKPLNPKHWETLTYEALNRCEYEFKVFVGLGFRGYCLASEVEGLGFRVWEALSPTWTPKVCKVMACTAVIVGLGPLFCIPLGFR